MRHILWWKQWGLVGVISLVVSAGTGCSGHIISETIRQQADLGIAFTQLQASPDAYRDRTVIFGGEMLQTRNMQQGTLLEILQKPLDHSSRPLRTDYSAGRFMASCENQYLDPAVYAAGREITVAGRVLGSRTEKIGEIDYVFPLLSCQQLHLWPQLEAYAPNVGWSWGFGFGYPAWYWRGHWGPRYRYWRPYPYRW